MIKKFLVEQEKNAAKAAAGTLAAMKSTVEDDNFGDNPDDDMSTSKSSQSAVDEPSLESGSTCSGGNPDEDQDDDATEYQEGGGAETGDEESEDDDKSFDLSDEENDKDDDMLDEDAIEDGAYPMADPKAMSEVFSAKYDKKDKNCFDGSIRAAKKLLQMERSLEADRKAQGQKVFSEMDDDAVVADGGVVCGLYLSVAERNRHITEAMKEKERILDENAAFKRWDSCYRHPTYPLYVDPTLMGRNYFCRASAPMPAVDTNDNAAAPMPAIDADDNAEKKPAAKPVVDLLWVDSDEEGAVVVKQEPKQALQVLAKKGRGNRKRPAGNPPQSALQQGDANIRLKLDGVKKPVETLQKMTIPLSRTDDGEEDAEENEWPWVIHGCFCYTEQHPNEDGQKSDPERLAKPQLQFWAGSEQCKEHLEGQLAGVTGMDVVVHSNYESYKRAFRSESGMTKPAPPPGDKKPTTIDFLKFS